MKYKKQRFYFILRILKGLILFDKKGIKDDWEWLKLYYKNNKKKRI